LSLKDVYEVTKILIENPITLLFSLIPHLYKFSNLKSWFNISIAVSTQKVLFLPFYKVRSPQNFISYKSVVQSSPDFNTM
jgi:hypothetical protein